MKIRTRLASVGILALFPMWIGISVIAGIGRASDKAKTTDLIEEYTSSIAVRIASFFNAAADMAADLASLQGSLQTEWTSGGGDMFADFVSRSPYVYRATLIDLDGNVYDAYADGPQGNPFQGGRRTENNAIPNSPPIKLNDRPYYRALVDGNPRGEFRVIVNEPYIPRGFSQKYLLTSAPVIAGGRTIGVVNMAQTSNGLSLFYEEVTDNFMDRFGEEASLYLISESGQLVSVLQYNRQSGEYEDTLAGSAEIFTVEDALDADISAAFKASTDRQGAAVAKIGGKAHFMM